MEQLISPDMVAMRVRIDHAGELPALCVQNFKCFFGGILSAATINEASMAFILKKKADFNWAVDIIGAFPCPDELIHIRNLPCIFI